MIIYSEKFYNESAEAINNKINHHYSKKLLNTETNNINKYKLIKERVFATNKPNSEIERKMIEIKNLKERNLILENKVKIFDDITAVLKNKIIEKDELVKNLSENIEKNKIKIRELKDEIGKFKTKEVIEINKDINIIKNNQLQESKKILENDSIIKKSLKLRKQNIRMNYLRQILLKCIIFYRLV
jgi:hypothetical protein